MNRRNGYRPAYGGNFGRSRAAGSGYSHGALAARIEDKRDEVSLKYYGRLKRIEGRAAVRGIIPKVICSLIVCACAAAIVFARSSVYNFQLENSRLGEELEAMRDKTASTLAQSTEKIDLAYVEEAASKRLNMAKPQVWQIEYIEVPKTDYTVLHEASTVVEKEKPVLVTYKNVFTGIIEAGELLIGGKTGAPTE